MEMDTGLSPMQVFRVSQVEQEVQGLREDVVARKTDRLQGQGNAAEATG